jgi:DNA-binding transcriptional LysR family regulator
MSRIERAAKGKTRWNSLGTTPWIAANVLPPVIQAFRQQRPNGGIRLFNSSLNVIEWRVKAGKLDLALGLFNKMLYVIRSRCHPLAGSSTPLASSR